MNFVNFFHGERAGSCSQQCRCVVAAKSSKAYIIAVRNSSQADVQLGWLVVYSLLLKNNHKVNFKVCPLRSALIPDGESVKA